MGIDPVSLALAAGAQKRINIGGRANTPPLRIVGNRGVPMGGFNDVVGTGPTPITMLESRYRVWLHTDCANVQFAFANWKDNGNLAPADNLNDISVRSAIELDQVVYEGSTEATTFIPLAIDGLRNPTIEAGATRLTDPAGVDFSKGQAFYIRTAVTVAANLQSIPTGYGATLGGSAEQAVRSTGQAHQIYGTGQLALGAGGVVTTNGYGPCAVLGIPKDDKTPSILVFGDSIPWGQGDISTGDGIGGRGFMTRGLNLAGVPHANLARSGKTPRLSLVQYDFRSRWFMQFASDIIFQVGLNQMAATPPARTLAYLAEGWGYARSIRKRAWQTLVSVQVAAGSNTSTTSQTVDPTFAANRAAVNQGIIDAFNAGLIDGYFYPGAAWEDPNNPGRFLPAAGNGGSDLNHPNQFGHEQAALITRDYINSTILK